MNLRVSSVCSVSQWTSLSVNLRLTFEFFFVTW